jgi:hypothetical protein
LFPLNINFRFSNKPLSFVIFFNLAFEFLNFSKFQPFFISFNFIHDSIKWSPYLGIFSNLIFDFLIFNYLVNYSSFLFFFSISSLIVFFILFFLNYSFTFFKKLCGWNLFREIFNIRWRDMVNHKIERWICKWFEWVYLYFQTLNMINLALNFKNTHEFQSIKFYIFLKTINLIIYV